MSISSFFWLNSLVKAIEHGHASHSQISHISQFGLRPMLYQQLNTLTEHDHKWLNIAKVLAKEDGEVALKLAKYYLAIKVQSKATKKNAKLWLSQAVRLNNPQARLMVAKIYIEEKKFSKAVKVLQPIKNQFSALKLLIEVSIYNGEKESTASYIQALKSLNLLGKNEELKAFNQKLDEYGITKSLTTKYTTKCLATIAPFATNLKNLSALEKLITSPKIALFQPYICFSPVKYISEVELDCYHDESEAIRCDESIWQHNEDLISQKSRFLAVLVDKGGANVNSGILYIDSHDNEEVFIHELAHLLGFIDEYPLPKNHIRCLNVQNSMFSHNISVLPRFYQGTKNTVRKEILKQLPWKKYILDSTLLINKTAKGWELGTTGESENTVGVFIAETCNEKDFVAVKPLNQRTAMRYFEEDFPNFYMQLLADEPSSFLMSSYQHNVTTALNAKK